jgi:hypothetical protein
MKVTILKQQIKIRIYPDGKIEAKTHGIKGKKCANYIQVLEHMLEAKTVESSYTDEYYQEQQVINEETNQIINN